MFVSSEGIVVLSRLHPSIVHSVLRLFHARSRLSIVGLFRGRQIAITMQESQRRDLKGGEGCLSLLCGPTRGWSSILRERGMMDCGGQERIQPGRS